MQYIPHSFSKPEYKTYQAILLLIDNVKNLKNQSFLRIIYHISKNKSNNFTSLSFSYLFHHDGTSSIKSVYKAEPFFKTSAYNYWMILSLFFPLLLPPIISCL